MHLLSDFDYTLPDELIARYPAAERGSSRLLQLQKNTGAVSHGQFRDLLQLLQPGDLLVFNNTKVIPARLFAKKPTGGNVEILLERILQNNRVIAHVRASKGLKPGSVVRLENHIEVQCIKQQNELFELEFLCEQNIFSILDEVGHIPLPQYMERQDEKDDIQRYQTVYAKHPGAVAAPTAGLHFDESMLIELNKKGVNSAFVTLHVGAGTFKPVRVTHIAEHVMHAEYAEVSAEVCRLVQETRAKGKRIIAVGTTSVRCLETAAKTGEIQEFRGDTNIFIYPGYRFQCVDALITNFHLPQSTLLMLVGAFAGLSKILSAYEQAIAEKYRFYSYGDAMFIE